MGFTEGFLFNVMDHVEGAVKQAKNIAKDVSDTLAPVAEEVVGATATHLEKAAATVSDEFKKASDASEAAANKENGKEILQALSHYATKTSMSSDVIEAMHKVSSYYNSGTPFFSGTADDTELLVLIMTAMHCSMQKASLSSYKKMVEWVVTQYRAANH